MNVLIHLDALDSPSVRLRLPDLDFYIISVVHLDLVVHFLDGFFGKLVRAQGHSEVVGCSQQQGRQLWDHIVIDLVHAKVEMLKLRVLDRHPLCYDFAFSILPLALLDVVELGNRLLWLLRGLQLLVLLDDGIPLLQLGEVAFDLVLRESKSSNQVEERGNMMRFKVQL